MFRRIFSFLFLLPKPAPKFKFYVNVPGSPHGELTGTNDPKEAELLRQGYFIRADGKVACTTCGGNCGQCGNTAKLGNIGYNLNHMVKQLR